MALKGHTLEVSGGDLLVYYSDITDDTECLQRCLERTKCSNVEHNYGSGDCTLYSTVTSLFSTMNTFISLYEKDCAGRSWNWIG